MVNYLVCDDVAKQRHIHAALQFARHANATYAKGCCVSRWSRSDTGRLDRIGRPLAARDSFFYRMLGTVLEFKGALSFVIKAGREGNKGFKAARPG